MSLFNQTNQLGREVSELKKLVESMDTKVKQLQKRVQEKSAVEIEHEDVKRRVYSPHEVVVKTRKDFHWPIWPIGLLYGCGILFLLFMMVLIASMCIERASRDGWTRTSYNNQSDSQCLLRCKSKCDNRDSFF
ncbi:hypothetical protein M3Y96_00913500 [Aphelenchoides besseyi]|nr:hypothetical protein M3Y96_00913500 [Aphelenchoides besseyi]